jgi:hypothetical protein
MLIRPVDRLRSVGIGCLPMKDETDEVQEVFDHWVTLSWTGRGVQPVLTDKRRRLVARAVKDYGTEVCKAAVTGNSTSPWHQGQNPGRKKYNSIELILRDAEHIERFANMVYDDPAAGFLGS